MGDLRDDDSFERAGRGQHDEPIAQLVLCACEEFSGAAALDGTLAQPVAQIGSGRVVETAEAEIAADTQRLSAFRLRTTRPVEEQHCGKSS